jgi:replicative DNA helicase
MIFYEALDPRPRLKKLEPGVKIDKLPPQNLEAEAGVLGSLLLDGEATIKVADILGAGDFYKEAHRHIYEAVMELVERHSPVDVLTISNRLEEKGLLEQVGGSSYLTTLVASVPTSAHARHYAEIVAKKATLRRLIQTAAEVTAMGYEESADVESLLDQAEQLVFKVSQKNLKENFTSLKHVLTESFDRIDELHKDKAKMRGIPTGFRDLDQKVLAGLQPSDLVIVAARPSMGKTSFALNIARHLAVTEGIPVGVFSLETSKEQLVDRMLSAEARIDSWRLRTGNLQDEDFPKIGQAMAQLSEAPIFIDDSPMINVMEMRAKARRLQAEHGLGLIIVDYLQLMQGRGLENRVQEISEISRGLKALARELDVPVIALSQLSRAVEARSPKIPMLSDLRESGSIEQDADVVMFIYREDYYERETERKNIADILVRKHRNGPVGEIELYFQPEFTQFRNLDVRHQPKSSDGS